jgi:hypothetical protein
MGSSQEDIQEALERYATLYLNDKHIDCIENISMEMDSFDVYRALAQFQDRLKDGDVDVCVLSCESKCRCRLDHPEDPCDCESPDYWSSFQTTFTEGSNASLIVDLYFKGTVTLPHFKNVRVFTLNKTNDEEIWMMDILKIVSSKKIQGKKKKSKFIEDCWLILTHDAFTEWFLCFQLFEVPRLRGKRFSFKIDTRHYECLSKEEILARFS